MADDDNDKPEQGPLSKSMGWIASGFALFGFTVGLITAVSSAEGVSETLLTSLFTFVAGSILTFAGFRYVKKKDAPLDPDRVGKGMVAFSAGILAGLLAGVPLATWYDSTFTVVDAEGRRRPRGMLQAGGRSTCETYQRKLGTSEYNGEENTQAYAALRTVVEACLEDPD